LDCMAEYKGVVFRQTQNEDTSHDNINWEETSLLARFHEDFGSHSEDHADQSGMELTFGQKEKKGVESMSDYDVFFPAEEVKKRRKSNKKTAAEGTEKKGNCTDVDAALTLHRIAQLHRSNGEHQKALEAFHVSLRGMKFALGKSHPNVAAVLGNIGNLQKEMGDMDAAYSTYQQVLAIESYRLGLSHPDVVVTLHNIATIDASRGNHEHSLSLYTQVINLQRKLFGEDHESVAVTSACMGDVYERLGDIKSAVDAYEEALRIKIVSLGRHSLEVARILHKLGKLAISDDDYHLAHSYISKASLVYKLNKLGDDEPWVVDIRRDCADVDAAIAMGRGVDFFEC
jgi:tetratricopeptide (TPR) repeat protein